MAKSHSFSVEQVAQELQVTTEVVYKAIIKANIFIQCNRHGEYYKFGKVTKNKIVEEITRPPKPAPPVDPPLPIKDRARQIVLKAKEIAAREKERRRLEKEQLLLEREEKFQKLRIELLAKLNPVGKWYPRKINRKKSVVTVVNSTQAHYI